MGFHLMGQEFMRGTRGPLGGDWAPWKAESETVLVDRILLVGSTAGAD